MSIVVFYLELPDEDDSSGRLPNCIHFDSDQLSAALKRAEDLRKSGHRHVTISSELDNCVSKQGVDTVADGKTPNGETYDWSKAGRAGAMKRHERS
jgi:hypothetical protein